MMLFFTTVSGKRRVGLLVKANHHTFWLRVMKGAKSSFIIKRKLGRDRIRFFKFEDEERSRNATAYSVSW